MSSATEILNLLYAYAERMDLGDLDGTAELFRHAKIEKGCGPPFDHREILEYWRTVVILYPDGTPRTKHVITNPILDIDEPAGLASCRSYYTVFQSTQDFPLQAIATGRYHDRFERKDDTWRFIFRDYRLGDLRGDLSRHVRAQARADFFKARETQFAKRC
jgi:hypothetical protein